MTTAFGISSDDIEDVLRNHSLHVASTDGRSFEDMAIELLADIDEARIERAALKAGCDMDEQTRAAHEEIHTILVEQGVLKR